MVEFDIFLKHIEKERKEKKLPFVYAKDVKGLSHNKQGLECLLYSYIGEIYFKDKNGNPKYVFASSNPYLIEHFDVANKNKGSFKRTNSSLHVLTWDFVKNGPCSINLKYWEGGRFFKIDPEYFESINASLINLISMKKSDNNLDDKLDKMFRM